MGKKIISLDEFKKEKFIGKIPKIFNLEDAVKYSEKIEYNLNSLYELALEDKKYHSLCTEEQIKLLSNVYMSFFKILYSEIEDFDESKDSDRIILKFISELYKICHNLTDIEIIRKNYDENNTLIEEENDEEMPKVFQLEEALEYTNQINNYLNSLYELALKNEKYQSLCTNEQIKVLVKIYSIFFEILFSEIEEFNETKTSNRIMLKFMLELYKVCDELTDINAIRQNCDEKTLKFEKKED